ncbi:MAG: hypothetical protein Q4F38_07910 [Akkermansia sp.]|nr:hypothetical protein [Akkermansia sp.]
MGFMTPDTPAVDTTPPVVADVADDDTRNAHDQKASLRKGLLSTILSNQKNTGGAMSASTGNSGNSTLG